MSAEGTRTGKIDYSSLQPGDKGTLIVANVSVETKTAKPGGRPTRTRTSVASDTAPMIEVRGTRARHARKPVQRVPWDGRWFLEAGKQKNIVAHVDGAIAPLEGTSRRARQKVVEEALRGAGKLPKGGEVVFDERRLRYMKALDAAGRPTGVTLVTETTRIPFVAAWWKLPWTTGCGA